MQARLPYSPVLALTHGFRTTYRHLPVYDFLVPLALRSPMQKWPSVQESQRSQCHRYSTAVAGENTSNAPLAYTSKPRSPSSQAPSRSQSQNAWTELLDQYLPLELRSKGWLENLAAFEGVRPIHTLPPLIIEAREFFSLGLLGYIAIHQGRWPVLMWLIKELVTCDMLRTNSMENVLQYELLDYGPGSLDGLSSKPIVLKVKNDFPSLRWSGSLDQVTEKYEPEGIGIPPGMMRDVIGQIWQSVAQIILEATNEEPETCKKMMSYAHRIIALLHHYQKIPNSIYTKGTYRVSPHIRKPPTLELLSSRILTILSDSVWKAREQEVIAEAASVGAKYVYKGHELPGAEYQPRIPPLETQIWLELVLWSCVESSMVVDAAKIVAEMIRAKGNKRWQVITWESLQALNSKQAEDRTAVTPGLIRWWLNSIAGVSAGYNDDAPPLELGERTVSSEVVAAIADGLVSTSTDSGNRSGLMASAVRHYINGCKALLERQTAVSRPTFWNSILLRLLAFDYYDPGNLPRILERLLDMAPKNVKRPQDIKGNAEGDVEGDADHRGASFGLLHRTMHAYIRLGSITGALQTFRRLQKWIDTTRVQAVQEFWHDFDSMSEEGQTNEIKDIAGLDYEIPPITLASFLDLLRSAREYDLGRWLLYSQEIDGPVIPTALYGSPIMQPALLRFASATADQELMIKVTQSLAQTGQVYTKTVLRTVLQCQFRSGRWKEVDDLLKHLTQELRSPLKSYDIMVFAATILDLEYGRPALADRQTQLRQAQDTLERVMSGSYQPKKNPSQRLIYSLERQTNQLCRILASIPGPLNAVTQKFIKQNGPNHTPVLINANAFNVLLGAVVDAFGSHVGKCLFDRWCRIPDEPLASYEPIPEGDPRVRNEVISRTEDGTFPLERVVIPNLQTIQIILRPLLRPEQSIRGVLQKFESEVWKTSQEKSQHILSFGLKGREPSVHAPNLTPMFTDFQTSQVPLMPTEESTLLAWGVATYRRLGLSASEINMAIPGSFPSRERVHQQKAAGQLNP